MKPKKAEVKPKINVDSLFESAGNGLDSVLESAGKGWESLIRSAGNGLKSLKKAAEPKEKKDNPKSTSETKSPALPTSYHFDLQLNHFLLVSQEPLYTQTKEFIDFLKNIENLEKKSTATISQLTQLLGNHTHKIGFPTYGKPEPSEYFRLAKDYFIVKIKHNFEKLPILKENKEIDNEKVKLKALIEKRNKEYKENATLRLNELNQEIKAKVIKLKYDIITPEEEQQLKENKDGDIRTINAFINSLETPNQGDDSEIKLGNSLRELKAQQKEVRQECKKIEEEKTALTQAISEKGENNKDLTRVVDVNISLIQLKMHAITEERKATSDKLEKEIKTTEQEFKSNAKEPKQPTDSKYETKHEFSAVPLVRLEARIKVYGEKLFDKINERADKYGKGMRFEKTKKKHNKIVAIGKTMKELNTKIDHKKWAECEKDLANLRKELLENGDNNNFKFLVETNRSAWGSGLWQSQCGATTNEEIFFHLAEKWMDSMEAMLEEIQRKQPQIQPTSNPSIDVSPSSSSFLRESRRTDFPSVPERTENEISSNSDTTRLISS